jgi:FkbM family methyltransferase
MYYGQFLDDKLIEEYFDSNYIGGCIDVGATNGIDINNTRYFEEKGWYCLCIEPNPNSFSQLKNNRANSLNFAISNFNKDLVDFTVVNLNRGSNEDEGAISSLIIDDKLMQQHKDMGFNITTKDIKVSTRTLDYCIEKYYKFDKIDFLDIDTEGTELDVLKGFNINRWQPKLIVVENNYNESFVEDYLKTFNYIKDKRVGVNDYYIKNKKMSFLIGPKLGDFFHSLYAVKCLSNGFKSDVYITEGLDKFSNGLENTYNDIHDIVISQDYIDNFLIYDNKIEDYYYIDYRNLDYLFKTTWYDIFQKIFNITNKFENEPWLSSLNKLNENKIIISFSNGRYSDNYDEILENILKNNNCIFISTNIEEYNNFKFKNLVEFKKCNNFSELYSEIASCKFFIGNQSMPLALAHGLFKHHIGFLHSIDAIHYKDSFNKQYFWFDDQKNISDNFSEIHSFLKLEKFEVNPILKNLNDIEFQLSYSKYENRVHIYCNYKIDLYIIIYEYDIVENKKMLLYSTLTNFDSNSYWYSADTKHLKDINYIKIEIRYNETLLKEKIIKIE